MSWILTVSVTNAMTCKLFRIIKGGLLVLIVQVYMFINGADLLYKLKRVLPVVQIAHISITILVVAGHIRLTA